MAFLNFLPRERDYLKLSCKPQETPTKTLLTMHSQEERLRQRGTIVVLRGRGMSNTAVARELGITKPTVRPWWRRWQESRNLNGKHRSGGPRKTSGEDDRQILDRSQQSPFKNAVAIRDELHLEVCAHAVRNRLHVVDIHHRIPTKKGKLEESHKQARLAFARRGGMLINP
ncbi:uncharacterized protein [Macrobrachium rosenbergii]|uniref:uncharacterized protein n=1 Tax=Macrobrachium rosenbergii TaxID=79674 RepID=UPI0034D53EC5